MIENIIFLQSNDEVNEEAFRLLNEEGETAVVEYLKQWHYPGEHGTTDFPAAGSSDDTFRTADGYILTFNRRLGYIGLEYQEETND